MTQIWRKHEGKIWVKKGLHRADGRDTLQLRIANYELRITNS